MAGQVLLKIACLLMRWLFGLAILVIRIDGAKNAELLARSPRHRSRPGTCQIRRKPVMNGLINEYERAA